MDNNNNNIIPFPKKNIKIRSENSPNLEEIQNNLEMMKHYHIQETIATVIPIIFNQLDISGFYVPDEESEDETADIKEGALIVESIRSLMCKHYGMYHPFQRIAEDVFIQDQEDENSFKIVEELNIVLKQSETE